MHTAQSYVSRCFLAALARSLQSVHHSHKKHVEHRNCNLGGGVFCAALLCSDQNLCTPPPTLKIRFCYRDLEGNGQSSNGAKSAQRFQGFSEVFRGFIFREGFLFEMIKKVLGSSQNHFSLSVTFYPPRRMFIRGLLWMWYMVGGLLLALFGMIRLTGKSCSARYWLPHFIAREAGRQVRSSSATLSQAPPSYRSGRYGFGVFGARRSLRGNTIRGNRPERF